MKTRGIKMKSKKLAWMSGILVTVAGLMAANIALAAEKDEQGVRQAVAQFYTALNTMFTGELGPMKEVWAHANDNAAQETLQQLWEEHVRHEFATHNTDDTLATMVEDAYVNHIPVLTGGVGKDELREFYSKRFIPQMPPDTEMTPISRTIGNDQLVDEMVFKFTHSIPMDWMLPGIPPTGKRVEVPLVAIIRFKEGKLAHEHIYWDQASVLAQIGLIDSASLPVAGVESARKVLDPTLPANALMRRGDQIQ